MKETRPCRKKLSLGTAAEDNIRRSVGDSLAVLSECIVRTELLIYGFNWLLILLVAVSARSWAYSNCED